MGTGVSIDVPGLKDARLLDRAFARLTQIDRRYSTFKDSSEVSRFRRGELLESELSPELRKVMRACIKMEKLTGGYFSAWFDGQFDPTGYVKGWSIKQASNVIKKAGFGTYCVGIGGDVYASSDSDKIWRIGVENPEDPSKIIGIISARNISVCTSGVYKRGQHLVSPKSRRQIHYYQSVTVAGPSVVKSDVFATAAYVMARQGPEFIAEQSRYAAMFINKDGSLILTPGMEKLLGQQTLAV